MRPNIRRPGLSLTEVLVAMFVMALGLMALLTLFPLGAMQVGQALKDDRTAQTASQADAWVRVWWRDAVVPFNGNPNAMPGDTALLASEDPNILTGGFARSDSTTTPPTNSRFYSAPYLAGPGLLLLPTSSGGPNPSLGIFAGPAQPFVVNPPNPNQTLQVTNVLQDVDGTFTSTNPQARFVGVAPSGVTAAGYPMLVDPLGFTATRAGVGANDRFWVGRNTGIVYGQAAGSVPLLLPRRNTAVTPTGTSAYAACALTDDLTFQANGASGTGTEPLARQGRYHWAALIQRPDNSKPDTANLTVLVFDGRPPFLGITGDEVVLTNGFFTGAAGVDGVVTAGDRSITIRPPTRGADQPPLVRRGGWVMIVSLTNGVRSVGFHRVTGLTTGDDTTTGTPAVPVTPVSLDIDPPVKTTLAAGQAQVYLLAGLSEVFERPLLTP